VTSLITVAETAAYLSKAERLLSETERAALVDRIAAAPDTGSLIPGTGGLRKLRFGMEGRGKRGGGRVIYWFHSQRYPAVLLWAFAKNEADDLTPDQRKKLMKAANALLDDFGGEP
jgi:mRNA-degrading endonuclease RelE of RelBE toxin-antitoxin system